jgi:hypothetical protein
MELLLGATVVAVAIGFVVWPLFRPAQTADEPRAEAAPSGIANRRQIYREVLELEFDHRVGKLTDEDHRSLSEACLARATALVAEEERRIEAAERRVEQEIAEMRRALRERGAGAERATETVER